MRGGRSCLSVEKRPTPPCSPPSAPTPPSFGSPARPRASPSDSASSGSSAAGFGEEQKSRGVLKSVVGMG
jgi:hypothetical protein